MSNMHLMQAASLLAGDADPSATHWLDILGVKLPMLQENTTDHKPGGGGLGLKIAMGQFEALMVSFKVKGLAPDLLRKIGATGARRIKYTIRGSVLNLRSNVEEPALAVVEGRMIKADLSEFSQDNGMDADFEIHEVVYYELRINDAEVYYMDGFDPAGIRINGVPTQAARARNLGFV